MRSGSEMKARLQTSLGQHLVLTPQLRQSLHFLQLSAHELEAELAEAVESNPLLDWTEPAPVTTEAAQEGEAEQGCGGNAGKVAHRYMVGEFGTNGTGVTALSSWRYLHRVTASLPGR
jgi:DNA-directed RNA polymerase specialized sigma54-like protein